MQQSSFNVRFGDCDPAGISFYPNTFRWIDATFHDLLKNFGGHAILCEKLDAKGLGLASADAQFRSPLTDGDLLRVTLEIEKWGPRSVTIRYTGQVGSRLAFEATEVRCLFKTGERGVFAAPMDAVRKILEEGTDG
ncbi:acyl-CoA thioesterase [Pseudooceanicola nitratireducens]|uniref:acyl-CoA thioesterase n=1 Tax=Pseudooceanicola nitratireducens TaxID=517719 RepID=UPI003C7995FD